VKGYLTQRAQRTRRKAEINGETAVPSIASRAVSHRDTEKIISRVKNLIIRGEDPESGYNRGSCKCGGFNVEDAEEGKGKLKIRGKSWTRRHGDMEKGPRPERCSGFFISAKSVGFLNTKYTK